MRTGTAAPHHPAPHIPVTVAGTGEVGAVLYTEGVGFTAAGHVHFHAQVGAEQLMGVVVQGHEKVTVPFVTVGSIEAMVPFRSVSFTRTVASPPVCSWSAKHPKPRLSL